MYCSNCGARVPDGAEFCAACGASVREIPPQRPEYSPQQKRNNNSVIMIALVAVAVVLVAAIVCFTILTRGKQQAQMAAIQAEQTAQQAEQAAEQSKEDVKEQAEAAAQKVLEESEKNKEDEKDTSGTTVNNYYYYNTTNHTDDYYSKVKSSGYLWPTDTMYISSSDLSGLGQDTVAAIRNEIYARHGYAFETARWKEYFSQKSWYVRDSSCTESTVNSRLSSIEKANVDTIVAYEESMGWR